MTLLQAEQLTVRYGSRAALDGVSFSLRPGITGLLGANGAGKSTLIRVLATLQRPTSGVLRWDGEDVFRRPRRLRQQLGYVPQDVGAYPSLTALEFLQYMAAVKGLAPRDSDPQARQLLHDLNLEAVAHRPLLACSGGMRQRVAVAQALLGQPHLIVLDEPTVGLDPEERARLRHLLADLGKERLVLLATHVTSDLDACARDVLVLQEGRVAYHGPQAAYHPSVLRGGASAAPPSVPVRPHARAVPHG